MKIILQAFKLLLVLTVLTGMIYPFAVTAIAQIFFPDQANGSLIKKNGQWIGSELLAQKFQEEKYFWSRPSAADFSTVPSGASNQGPTHAGLKELVRKREEIFRKTNGVSPDKNIPSDRVFASASGVDPHISPEAARLQVKRVAEARHLDERGLYRRVEEHTELPQFGIFGEPRVNVLRLNIALDSSAAEEIRREPADA